MPKFASDIDLAKNQLKSAVIEKLAANPGSPVEAQIFYDTVAHTAKLHNGTAFKEIVLSTLMDLADFATGVVSTDTTLASASDTTIATTLAVKTYVDGVLAASDALVFKGGVDASTNPNYPAANAGDVYKITVAGKIGGASGETVQVGDTIICTVDGSVSGNQATVGANWLILQTNMVQATTAIVGFSRYATQAESKAKTETAAAVTPASLADFPVKVSADIGDGSATAIVLAHNLNTKDISVTVHEKSTDDVVVCDVQATGVNTATLTFSVAPTSNQYRVIVIG